MLPEHQERQAMSNSRMYEHVLSIPVTPEYQNRSTIELQTSTNSYTYVLVSYVIISDLSLNFLSCVQISAITCNNRVKKSFNTFSRHVRRSVATSSPRNARLFSLRIMLSIRSWSS
jgi:hypothetical protein